MDEPNLIPDYPDADCTDFAHPAWWRGYDYAANSLIRYINDLLDRKVDEGGTMNSPMEELKRRLIALRDE